MLVTFEKFNLFFKRLKRLFNESVKFILKKYLAMVRHRIAKLLKLLYTIIPIRLKIFSYNYDFPTLLMDKCT